MNLNHEILPDFGEGPPQDRPRAVLTDDEKKRQIAQLRRAIATLPQLKRYQAELHRPCEICGNLLFAPVQRGYRCLSCWPPIGMSQQDKKLLESIKEG